MKHLRKMRPEQGLWLFFGMVNVTHQLREWYGIFQVPTTTEPKKSNSYMHPYFQGQASNWYQWLFHIRWSNIEKKYGDRRILIACGFEYNNYIIFANSTP